MLFGTYIRNECIHHRIKRLKTHTSAYKKTYENNNSFTLFASILFIFSKKKKKLWDFHYLLIKNVYKEMM